eukprot:1281314-Pleurochrysis_carterae.AAC.1
MQPNAAVALVVSKCKVHNASSVSSSAQNYNDIRLLTSSPSSTDRQNTNNLESRGAAQHTHAAVARARALLSIVPFLLSMPRRDRCSVSMSQDFSFSRGGVRLDGNDSENDLDASPQIRCAGNEQENFHFSSGMRVNSELAGDCTLVIPVTSLCVSLQSRVKDPRGSLLWLHPVKNSRVVPK